MKLPFRGHQKAATDGAGAMLPPIGKVGVLRYGFFRVTSVTAHGQLASGPVGRRRATAARCLPEELPRKFPLPGVFRAPARKRQLGHVRLPASGSVSASPPPPRHALRHPADGLRNRRAVPAGCRDEGNALRPGPTTAFPAPHGASWRTASAWRSAGWSPPAAGRSLHAGSDGCSTCSKGDLHRTARMAQDGRGPLATRRAIGRGAPGAGRRDPCYFKITTYAGAEGAVRLPRLHERVNHHFAGQKQSRMMSLHCCTCQPALKVSTDRTPAFVAVAAGTALHGGAGPHADDPGANFFGRSTTRPGW